MGGKDGTTWQDVRAYAEEKRDLAVAGDIDDLEALAQISDEVAEWSEKEYIGIDMETFMFANGLAELLCREVIGWTGSEDNPNQIGGATDRREGKGGFGDSGFHPDYQETGGNQVDHFVAYLQAGYYLGLAPGLSLLYWNEDFRSNHPDVRLGEKAVWAGARILLNHAIWPASGFALKPSEVGAWILEKLTEPYSIL